MRYLPGWFVLCLLSGALVGCESMPPGAQSCPSPRPQVCTREYRPVCGVSDIGRRDYGNACSACADATVQYVLPGRCDGGPVKPPEPLGG